ncbi:uncharacterized protein J3R85_006403 [Psidium guajava]|nr:uncharacterized protein J3R85_006403 [Psidium guajava]
MAGRVDTLARTHHAGSPCSSSSRPRDRDSGPAANRHVAEASGFDGLLSQDKAVWYAPVHVSRDSRKVFGDSRVTIQCRNYWSWASTDRRGEARLPFDVCLGASRARPHKAPPISSLSDHSNTPSLPPLSIGNSMYLCSVRCPKSL